MRSQSKRKWSDWFFRATLIFSHLCSFTAYGGREDEASSLTGVGAGIIAQSFEISRHFVRPDNIEGSYFLKARDKNSILAKKEKVYLPLSWMLGGGFTYLASPAIGRYPDINDGVISLKGGLEWTLVPTFTLSMDLDIDNNTAENYNHGAVLFKFWKTFSLHSRSPADSTGGYDSSEADQYYERQWSQKQKALALKKKAITSEDEETEEGEGFAQFPEIQMGLILGFGEHLVGGKTYRRALVDPLREDQRLFQNRTGLEITYFPKEGLTLKLGGNIFYYNINVDTYLQYLEIRPLQRIPLFAQTGWSSSTNQLLTFPSLSFDQSLEFEVNEKEMFELFINESTYASNQQETTISASPRYTRELGKGWKVSVAPFVGLILKTGLVISGMVQVGYDLN
ncbi:MAG: hypothetical protein ABIQ95_09130 [Bdellovibrionia bacterium]